MASIQRRLARWAACFMLVSGLFIAPAHAGLVRTEDVASSAQAAQARQHIKELAQRPELAEQLTALGVSNEHAQERVDAMTDEEVIVAANKLDSLVAGGSLNNNELILILVIILLIVIL